LHQHSQPVTQLLEAVKLALLGALSGMTRQMRRRDRETSTPQPVPWGRGHASYPFQKAWLRVWFDRSHGKKLVLSQQQTRPLAAVFCRSLWLSGPLLIKDRCHRALSRPADWPIAGAVRQASLFQGELARDEASNSGPWSEKSRDGHRPRGAGRALHDKAAGGRAKKFYGEKRRSRFVLHLHMSVAIENIFQVHVNRSM
jgi:hypothetical protein